jgi:glycosyltransferase involved in cell wall biosynthesis
MKVAFTTDVYWPRINGVTVSTNVFLNELQKLGHEMRLWAPEYPAPEDSDKPHQHDAEVSRLKSFGLWFSKEDRLPRPWERKEFFRQLDAFGPDLIHIQTEFILGLMAQAYGRKHKIPIVQTCHTYFEQYINYYWPFLPPRIGKAFARWLTRRLFKHADLIITPTEPMRTVLLSYGIECPIKVIPTGIPEEDFAGVTKTEERAHSGWLEKYPVLRGKKLLLYVGRVGQEKNMDFLVDVVERVRKSVPEALLVVAGNGPYLADFQALIAKRNLSEAVLCLGYVNRQELKHLYALADVFTFASVTETQGLVTIEAMMCGTPAVAIGKMGTIEVMGGDNGGFMVEDDVEAFSLAVLKLLTDPQLYQAKSVEALAYSQNWTASRMAKRVEALYHEVLAART